MERDASRRQPYNRSHLENLKGRLRGPWQQRGPKMYPDAQQPDELERLNNLPNWISDGKELYSEEDETDG